MCLACVLVPAGAWAQAPVAIPAAPPASAAPVTRTSGLVPDQVAAAEAAIAATDWKTAEAKLDPWLAAHPTDARALFDAGYVADVQNRTADAEALYRRAVAADAKAFDPHLMLGMLLARQGKLTEARALIEAATHLDPGAGGPELKAKAWRALAKIDSNTDAAAASNDLLEALKLTPETTDDMLLAADLAVRSGQNDAAEAEYRKVLAVDPGSEPASAGLAHLLIEKKQYPEAETLLRTALKSAPGDPALTAQLAAVLVAEDKAEALPLLESLYKAHPANAAIARMLAEVRADAGDFAGSDALYTKLLAAAPQDEELLVGHGQNLVQLTKYAAAYEVFDKASRLKPGDGEAWSGLAFAASRTGRPAMTIHALEMRSKLLPETPATYFLWATAYDSLHQAKPAAAYYHQFLSAAAGKYPTEEWQAEQRLKLIGK